MNVGRFAVERTGRFWYLIDRETGAELMDRHGVWGCSFPTRRDALDEAYHRIDNERTFAAQHAS